MIGKQSTLNDLSGLDVKIDQKHTESMAAANAALARANSGIVGVQEANSDAGITNIGVRSLGIASVFTVNESKQFFHFKTTLRTDTDDAMFHFRFTGYDYTNSSAIDLTVCGYVYKIYNQIINVGVVGTNKPVSDGGVPLPTVYLSSDGFVTIRIQSMVSAHFFNVVMDSMKVGNGSIYNKDNVEVIQTNTDQESI